jgi:hypothetical protein
MVTTIKNTLPGTSRVWVYQSTRRFSPGETETIREKLRDFVTQWTSHKAGVIGDAELLFERFVVLMADEDKVGVSGCSIDSSVQFVKALGQEYRTNFFDRWNIAYLKDEDIKSCHKSEFEKLVEDGEIMDETIIFNNLIQSKSDFESKWQLPYHQSWLKNLSAAHTSFNSIL